MVGVGGRNLAVSLAPGRGSVGVAIVALGLPGGPTRNAAFGFIGEALGGVEFLLTRRESEGGPAVATTNGFLLVSH